MLSILVKYFNQTILTLLEYEILKFVSTVRGVLISIYEHFQELRVETILWQIFSHVFPCSNKLGVFLEESQKFWVIAQYF